MTRSLIILSLMFTFCAVASADVGDEPKNVYRPVGAPPDPKVPARWNRYHDYATATKMLKDLAAAHPKRCKLVSLGKSYGKRDMWLMTITNLDAGDADKKPAMWIDGGIHANEIQSVEVVLYTAWFLLESEPHNKFIQRLLRQRSFYLLPMMSPDSRDAHFYRPNTTHDPRTGQRPVDDDRDGLLDEDGPDDLDKDGNITQMRVKDPNGKFKAHPDYPQMMVRIKDGEKGQYTMLGREGIDNDGDGKVNEDGDGYYDPNRDWPWQWQPGHVQRGAYRYPLSVPENRIAADFILEHPNIAGGQSYHNTGGMILRGPGGKNSKYDGADVRVFDKIAKTGEEMLPGYRYLTVNSQLYVVYGGELDWLYAMRGAVTYTNELFTPFNFFRQHSDDPGFFGKEETRAKFNKYLLLDDGFVKWHEVDHPQYGKIEVGGIKKNWMRQPPSFLLEEECHRNMAFTLYHADQMPLVKLQSVDTRPLEGGLTEVTATIRNQRVIPTRLAVDVKNKITPPDIVSITGENLKVIVGMKSNDRFFQRPTEQKRRPSQIRINTIQGNSVVYIRWIVSGDGPFTVTAKSIKGGSDTMRIEKK